MNLKISLKHPTSLTSTEYKTISKIITSGIILTELETHRNDKNTRVVLAWKTDKKSRKIKIVGWALVYDVKKKGRKMTGSLMICVSKKHRRKGIGTLLMDIIHKKCRFHEYIVYTVDGAASGFFKSIKNMNLDRD